LQGANGIELIKLLRAEHPQLKILMLSMYEESVYALRALRAGALGYVMKGEELDQLRSALHKVTSGEIYVNKDTINSALKRLSHKQLEVLKLFGRGLGTREVASQLYVSRRTIETHRMRIKGKLGFTDANEMVRFAIDWYAQEKRI
jgi:DNA-binding NarL/FixJ family response regulator